MRSCFQTVGAVGLLALVGCADAPVGLPYYNPSYSPGEQGYAAASLPVVVRGNPFAMPQDKFALVVADEMRGWEHRTRRAMQPAIRYAPGRCRRRPGPAPWRRAGCRSSPPFVVAISR